MSIDNFILSANTTDLNYPNIRPTLDLNFARTKVLDPRITFTRSSGGSYVGPNGLIKYAGINEPRFDHNPVTGESLGLLIEEVRSNLTTYSEDFSNSRWTRTGFTLTSSTTETTAPDSSNNASKIIETDANSIHIQNSFNAYSITANTVYTASIFVKKINKQFVQLVFDDNATTNGGRVNFDLINGTITDIANYGTGALIAGTITQFSNGWYRLSISSTAGTTATLARFSVNGITSGSSGGFPGYTGNTANGYYLWGAQVEAGTFPTSYIPTTASTVTRTAELATMTGTNFSSWYNSSEGTLYTAAAPSTNAAYSGWIYLLGTDFNNGINFYRQSDYQPVIRIRSSQRDEYNKVSGAVGFGQLWRNAITLKSAFGFKTNDFNSCVAGTFSSISRGVSGTLPTFTGPLWLGGLNDGTQKLNGTISRLTYYPKALPPAQLQALTR